MALQALEKGPCPENFVVGCVFNRHVEMIEEKLGTMYMTPKGTKAGVVVASEYQWHIIANTSKVCLPNLSPHNGRPFGYNMESVARRAHDSVSLSQLMLIVT